MKSEAILKTSFGAWEKISIEVTVSGDDYLVERAETNWKQFKNVCKMALCTGEDTKTSVRSCAIILHELIGAGFQTPVTTTKGKRDGGDCFISKSHDLTIQVFVTYKAL